MIILLTNNNEYVIHWLTGGELLHHFVKKTQKTPLQEIKKAERNLKDFKERFGE